MEKEVLDKYGPHAEECAKRLSEGDLKDIAKCISNAIGDADPVEVLAKLTKWSLECAV